MLRHEFVPRRSVPSSKMIILDEEDQRKNFNDPYGGLTLRYPEKAVARSDSPLPDYETSEARQKHKDRKKVDPTLWRAVFISLGIYILLSVVIGVPIVVLVCYSVGLLHWVVQFSPSRDEIRRQAHLVCTILHLHGVPVQTRE